MKMYEFRLRFYWSLFPINNIPALVQSARRQAIIWSIDGLFTDAYMRHSASESFKQSSFR